VVGAEFVDQATGRVMLQVAEPGEEPVKIAVGVDVGVEQPVLDDTDDPGELFNPGPVDGDRVLVSGTRPVVFVGDGDGGNELGGPHERVAGWEVQGEVAGGGAGLDHDRVVVVVGERCVRGVDHDLDLGVTGADTGGHASALSVGCVRFSRSTSSSRAASSSSRDMALGLVAVGWFVLDVVSSMTSARSSVVAGSWWWLLDQPGWQA
jgi:hypothetical protein